MKENDFKVLKYIIVILLTAFVSVLLFYHISKEDVIPEPTLNLHIEGMGTVDYWLDLLVSEDDINYSRMFSVRVNEAVEVLANYEDDEGYHSAMLGGSNQKFVGGLDGFYRSDGSIRHEFWGEGIPKEFKVAILTRDKKLIVSDLVKTNIYHSEVRLKIDEVDTSKEVATSVGQIKEVFPWARIIFSFFVRLLAIVFIKISIIETFGFNSERSIKLLYKTTIFTQLCFSILLISQIFYGGRFALSMFVILSLVILIFEMILYYINLEDRKKPIRVFATILSNIAAFVAGYFLIYFVEWLSF